MPEKSKLYSVEDEDARKLNPETEGAERQEIFPEQVRETLFKKLEQYQEYIVQTFKKKLVEYPNEHSINEPEVDLTKLDEVDWNILTNAALEDMERAIKYVSSDNIDRIDDDDFTRLFESNLQKFEQYAQMAWLFNVLRSRFDNTNFDYMKYVDQIIKHFGKGE